jgi:hypothetical protein
MLPQTGGVVRRGLDLRGGQPAHPPSLLLLSCLSSVDCRVLVQALLSPPEAEDLSMTMMWVVVGGEAQPLAKRDLQVAGVAWNDLESLWRHPPAALPRCKPCLPPRRAPQALSGWW